MRFVKILLLPGLLLIILIALFAEYSMAAESERIVELMELRPGMRVADVGAGSGRWGEAMARVVGESGHVYLNEIDGGELGKIRDRIEDSDLGNMTAVEGELDDTMLPDACCDAILIRIAYHDMTYREEMRASIIRSLKPGGQLFIIEMDTGSHGIPEEELVADFTSDGFRVISRHPEWQDHDERYAILFHLEP